MKCSILVDLDFLNIVTFHSKEKQTVKWKNKGHELDRYAEKLIADLQKKEKYYIFGAGKLGKGLLPMFDVYEQAVVFIDNSVEKQESNMNGLEVISLERYLLKRDGLIIVAASAKNTPVIVRQLEASKLKRETDFWLYEEFVYYIFPIISTYYYNKAYVSLAQICLTERCSLKCRKCAHGCYAVNNSLACDLTSEQVYSSADSFFEKVDFIQEFVLIGGEPLLYKQLPEAVQYIGEHYRKQMGIFSITTNGTIVPDEETLKMCKQYNVLFRISNYSGTIPGLAAAYDRLTAKLQEKGIEYELGKAESEWTDYGFDYLNRNASEEELTRVFDACQTSCREIRENRYYFCVMARSVSENLGFRIGQNDFLDLAALRGEDYKKELLEFNLGYSEKGYLDMCNHCYGAERVNYPVQAAEQVGGNSNKN